MATGSYTAKQMRQAVFHHLLQQRGAKYRSFLRYLRLFKYVSFSPARGNFLEYYYTLMRYLDDIVDGDAPIPVKGISAERFLQAKIRFSKNPGDPSDEIDHLFLHCFEIARSFHSDFKQETADILSSLLFDAQRRGRNVFLTEEQLMQHYHLLDVRGTIRATLKIFREDPDKYLLLEPLGFASRFFYDLRDFSADIKAGYINISTEDRERFGIEPCHLHQIESDKIQAWFYCQATRGLEYIHQHRRNLSKAHFSWLTLATLRLVYERPAVRFFNFVLENIPQSRILWYQKNYPVSIYSMAS